VRNEQTTRSSASSSAWRRIHVLICVWVSQMSDNWHRWNWWRRRHPLDFTDWWRRHVYHLRQRRVNRKRDEEDQREPVGGGPPRLVRACEYGNESTDRLEDRLFAENNAWRFFRRRLDKGLILLRHCAVLTLVNALACRLTEIRFSAG
jgi:hypothetical protein